MNDAPLSSKILALLDLFKKGATIAQWHAASPGVGKCYQTGSYFIYPTEDPGFSSFTLTTDERNIVIYADIAMINTDKVSLRQELEKAIGPFTLRPEVINPTSYKCSTMAGDRPLFILFSEYSNSDSVGYDNTVGLSFCWSDPSI